MKLLHKAGLTAGAVAGALALAMVVLAARTEADIRRHHLAVAQAGRASPSAAMPTAMPTAMPAVMPAVMPSASGDPSDASAVASAWASLPAPVQRYFAYTFRGQAPRLAFVELQMEGEFRRPKTQAFTPTTAEQTVATGVPAMMFSATTEMLPGIWARAYDAYVDGRMEMKAKVLSAVTVVDEKSSPELDRISLRRWLLESALYPMALLPGGPVRWEAIDEQRARAVVTYRGMTASLVARFAERGRLCRRGSQIARTPVRPRCPLRPEQAAGPRRVTSQAEATRARSSARLPSTRVAFPMKSARLDPYPLREASIHEDRLSGPPYQL